ncbi:MAG: hypothetical protein Fur0032_21770 [Terrimicrobiaceae bacterium]
MTFFITIGKSGRIVLPKPVREILGLREGSRLVLETKSGRIEATPAADSLVVQIQDGFPVIGDIPPLEKGTIVRALKEERNLGDIKRGGGTKLRRRE